MLVLFRLCSLFRWWQGEKEHPLPTYPYLHLLMNSRAYLERIGMTSGPKTGLAGLKQLQEQHLYHVPFENLDIHYQVPIKHADSYGKIVDRKRGGFCYELNGLFYRLLTSLGYNARMVSAQVYDKKKERFGPEFDHMAILVVEDQLTFLADVGFGDFALHPLLMVHGKEQTDPCGTFRIIPGTRHNKKLIQRKRDDLWENCYLLDLTPRKPEEFDGMCQYHQTSPESHFTRNKMCSTAVPDGRITLTDTVLKIRSKTDTRELHVENAGHFDQWLVRYFGPQFLPYPPPEADNAAASMR